MKRKYYTARKEVNLKLVIMRFLVLNFKVNHHITTFHWQHVHKVKIFLSSVTESLFVMGILPSEAMSK